jgi:Tfp pilus assembly protein PilO
MINKLVGLKVLILPLSSAAVIMIAVLFIKPAFSDVNTLKMAVGEDKKLLEQLQAQNVKMKEISGSLVSMDEKPMVMAALPEREETEKYLAEFYGRVSRSGVLLKSFSLIPESDGALSGCGMVLGTPFPSTAVGSSSMLESSTVTNVENTTAASQSVGATTSATQLSCPRTTKIDVTVRGNWEQVMSFLKYIEDTSRIVNITKADINPEQNESNQGPSDLLNTKVALQIFSKPKSENASIAQVNSLTSGDGLNKSILKKIEGAIYGSFDYNYDEEKTAGKNIFK